MVPPFGAVIGGFAMLALAIGAPDALVVDDYAHIEDLTRAKFAADGRAAELDLRAVIVFALDDGGRTRVTVELEAGSAFSAPHELSLRLRHAARADADRTLLLVRNGGTYVGEVELAVGRYAIELSSTDAAWRLASMANLPAAVELSPPTSPTQ
jgi:hypothetical protein